MSHGPDDSTIDMPGGGGAIDTPPEGTGSPGSGSMAGPDASSEASSDTSQGSIPGSSPSSSSVSSAAPDQSAAAPADRPDRPTGPAAAELGLRGELDGLVRFVGSANRSAAVATLGALDRAVAAAEWGGPIANGDSADNALNGDLVAALERLAGPAPDRVDELLARVDRLGAASVLQLRRLLDPAHDAAEPVPPGHARAAAAWWLGRIAARVGTVARVAGRVTLPAELFADVPDFGDRLIRSARQGHGVDRAFLGSSRVMVARLVHAGWERLIGTESMPGELPAPQRPAATWLLSLAGRRLARIEQWNAETCLHEPRPAPWTGWRLGLAARAGLLAHRPPVSIRPWSEIAAEAAVQARTQADAETSA